MLRHPVIELLATVPSATCIQLHSTLKYVQILSRVIVKLQCLQLRKMAMRFVGEKLFCGIHYGIHSYFHMAIVYTVV